MKQSFICSFILLLSVATGLYSKQAPEKHKGKTKQESTKSSRLSGFTEIQCTALELDSTRTSSRPMINSEQQKQIGSFNWSGYVALTNLKHPETRSVEVVSGAWVAPILQPTPDNSAVSIFVGMDGFASNSPTVEQIGTVHTMVGGTQTNFVFFEIFPGPAFELVGFPVNPGNVMGAEVAYVGNNKFILSIINFSLRIFTGVPVHVPGVKRNSAEWIVEAPSLNNALLPLANFTFVPFLECTAKIEGDVGAIDDDDWKFESIVMVSETPPFTPKAAPTKLRKHGTAFIVGWLSAGP